MQEAFEKLKGMDIFSLKSYMIKTGFGDFSGVWVMFNEIFVNFPFFLLNLIVGFFSLMIRILENVRLYDTYKQYVFSGAQSIWRGFTGATSGVAHSSLVFLILLCLAFYLFYQLLMSKGNFSQRLLHVLLVLFLGFGWFGTVAGTSGGLYLLNTVDNVASTTIHHISNVSVSYGKNQSLKIGSSVADSYIAETSYKAYLFVNTGQENGKYKDRQTGKEEPFEDSKVLGSLDKSGKFKAVSTADRNKYLEIGNGASDDNEHNRWVSAIPDYIPVKFFYILFKMVEAIVIAIPIVLIQLLNVLAQALVLIMILLFPIALLVSFIPKMQDILFGVFKVMFGGLAFPAITSLLTLALLYLEKISENLVSSGFDKVIGDFSSLSTFSALFELIVSVCAKGVIYWLLWKYKGELIELLLGSRAKITFDEIDTKVKETVTNGQEPLKQLPTKATNAFEMAQTSGNFFLAGAGLGAGLFMNAGKQMKTLFSNPHPTSEGTEDSTPPENDEEETPTTSSFEETGAPDEVTTPFQEPDMPMEIFESAIQEEDTSVQPFDTEPSPLMDTKQNREQKEFEERRQNRLSWRQKHHINKLEKELEPYKDDEALYQAQGSNAFIKNYRKTLPKDDKLKANINRKHQIIEELARLRGGKE
ncbi:TPA: conjugal transfer protein [Streptococcus agalactiae]|uniref:conjugal transfer protein n=2 Tax=Streptococcus agalactiae TaxID=1311 RepID=UPI0010C0F958|nr:conjugal transfer protein [Streptococcus agalactiae]MCC9782103.1 conjugal transfer protein [Streptococcus agalactiae]MCC9847215.1 conjugal transfer protein [Streptococcus agalactiae]MCK6277071.1 conjugal transfer protein [Streptococcus agalactiae]MCK6279368.1 conjugal transfer protein [Streptococcus agalactiae]MCK6345941.1 conjugal transfer protein [Streptococcus agalactiae]